VPRPAHQLRAAAGLDRPLHEQLFNYLTGAATDPANWKAWPIAMIPLALIGFLLALRLWNAKPKPKTT